jgi:AcrR family transcriptional regulator
MTTVAATTRAVGIAETRERIVSASYPLFAERSVRDVSMDEIVVSSGVAKATLYRHFPTKDDLVLAFLERREESWTYGVVADGARARASDPEGRLLAIFDVFDDWFRRDDFEACSFISVLLEMGKDHPLGQASTGHLANLRTLVSGFAVEAGIADPDEFARSWNIVMTGAIVQAAAGDRFAARRARAIAELLLEQNRPEPA